MMPLYRSAKVRRRAKKRDRDWRPVSTSHGQKAVDPQPLLQELGSIASAAMAVSRFTPTNGADADELDDIHSRMHALQLTVDPMGWVADVGLRALGGAPMMAGAEDWMLPGIHPLPA